jgi:hypothetical protein
VDSVHKDVDRAGPVHRGPVAIAAPVARVVGRGEKEGDGSTRVPVPGSPRLEGGRAVARRR